MWDKVSSNYRSQLDARFQTDQKMESRHECLLFSTLVSSCRFFYSVVANLFRHMIWDCSQRKVLKRPLINVDQSQTQNRISQKWTWDDQQDPNVVLQHAIKNHQLSERFLQGITRSQNIPEKNSKKMINKIPTLVSSIQLKRRWVEIPRGWKWRRWWSLGATHTQTHTHMYYMENHDVDYNIDTFGIFSPGWGFLVAMAKMLKPHSDLIDIFSHKDSRLLQTRK